MMHQLAKEFISNDNQVSIITPSSRISNQVEIEEIEGVEVLRFKSGRIKNVSRIIRAINESMLSIRAWHSLKTFFNANKYDFIIYYSPSIFFGPLVWKLKKIWSAKSFLVLRDIFPRWAIDNNLMSEYSPITLYFKFFEKINYLNADTIGLMSEKNLDFFNKSYKLNNKKIVLHNWISRFKVKKSKNNYRKQFNLEKKVVFFYGGNIGKAQDILAIVKLAEKMKNINNAHFFIVGDGESFNETNSEINILKLKNITLLKTVKREEYYDMLNQFDIGIFSLSKLHQTHNFPGKILEYLNFNKPVLGIVNPGNDLKDVVDKYKVGYVSNSGDSDSLLNNSKKLLIEENRNFLKKNINKILFETFSTNSAYKKLMKTLTKK